jgi:glycosyltransferase involved in cell wall biosynthesis
MSDQVSGIRRNGLPLVSIVISVYNAGAYLRPSVLSIVNQTYRNLDIIIIDDGSTDGCLDTVSDLLEDERIRVFRQENSTRPVALNRALDLVRGEFYATQDADDVSDPMRIETQLRSIESRPQLAVVFCGYCMLVDGKRIAPLFAAKGEEECSADIASLRIPAHDVTGLYRMSVVGNMRYDTSLPFVEGWDYVLRVGESHPMMVLEDCLYEYRWHPHSITQSDPHRREQMVNKALQRADERRGDSYGRTIPQERRRGYRSRNSIADNGIASVFVESVLSQRDTARRWGAVQTGVQCARLHPLDPVYYKALVCALMPARLLNSVRASKRRKP